ncbi:MAG TPA: hypothetical protein ENI94_04335 [Gammaproteobacteria bacterium]|nr:hypothetical protein [Gammaproteobacteria bacterium]
MNDERTEITDKAYTVVSDVVEKLGVDPCLLAIIVVVIVFVYLIRFTYKHQEKMETLRMTQWVKIMKGNGNGAD